MVHYHLTSLKWCSGLIFFSVKMSSPCTFYTPVINVSNCISEIGHTSWNSLALNIVHDLFTDLFMPCHVPKKDLRQDMSWRVLDLVPALSFIWLMSLANSTAREQYWRQLVLQNVLWCIFCQASSNSEMITV